MSEQMLDARDMIPFNRPACGEHEAQLVSRAMESGVIGPNGDFVRDCQEWLAARFEVPRVLATGSCTAALEIAAMLLGLEAGDEVIVPSFGYPSTASAIARTGASVVFVDVDPATMNLAPDAVEAAVTQNTKAVMVIHYAGVACDMDRIATIAAKHDLAIIEDAAHAFLAKHRAHWCGTLGTFGCFSFHETKSVHCGQGGALVINRPEFIERAEILLDKGTNRRQFQRGEVDRYTWQDIGSAYALDDLRGAFLLAQLQRSDDITMQRLKAWEDYHALLTPLSQTGKVEIAHWPDYAGINGHIFWLKVADEAQRSDLISFLAASGIHVVFHFVPLHSAHAGRRFGRFHGSDNYTTRDSARLIRLPIYHGFREANRVVERIRAYFEGAGA